MAEQIIEGRVIQKVATAAEWAAGTLPLKKGEFAIVSDSTGKPINIRVGNGTLPFSGLVDMFDNIQQNVNFIKYNGGSALPSPTIDTGYTFVSEGSYTFGGSPAFTVPAGHWGTANWDGNSWSFTDLGEIRGEQGEDGASLLAPWVSGQSYPLNTEVRKVIDGKNVSYVNDVAGNTTDPELLQGWSKVSSDVELDVEGGAASYHLISEMVNGDPLVPKDIAYDNSSTTINGFYNQTGQFSASANIKCSDFLPVVPGDRCISTKCYGQPGVNNLLLFDEDKNFVGVLTPPATTVGGIVNFDVGIVIKGFVVFQNRFTSGIDINMTIKTKVSKKLVVDTGAVFIYQDDIDKKVADKDDVINIIEGRNFTKEYKDVKVVGEFSQYLYITNLGVITSSTSANRSLVSISGKIGKTITYRGRNAGSGTIPNAIYVQSNGTVIIVSPGSTNEFSGTYTPSETGTFYINFLSSGQYTYDLYYKEDRIVSFVYRRPVLLPNKVKISLITYAAIGDSITAGYPLFNYQKQINDLLGFSKVTTYGYPSHTVKGLLQYVSTWEVHDIYSLYIGINDHNQTIGNTEIGQISDFINRTGVDTFYGALGALVDAIYQLNPNSKLLFCSPHQVNTIGLGSASWQRDAFTPNSKGYTLEDYSNALGAVARRMSFPYADVFHESNINTKNVRLIAGDGVHPTTEEGYNRIAKVLYPEILKII